MFAFRTWRSCQAQPVPSVKAGLTILQTTRSRGYMALSKTHFSLNAPGSCSFQSFESLTWNVSDLF